MIKILGDYSRKIPILLGNDQLREILKVWQERPTSQKEFICFKFVTSRRESPSGVVREEGKGPILTYADGQVVAMKRSDCSAQGRCGAGLNVSTWYWAIDHKNIRDIVWRPEDRQGLVHVALLCQIRDIVVIPETISDGIIGKFRVRKLKVIGQAT